MVRFPKTLALGAVLLCSLSGARGVEEPSIWAPPPGTVAIPAIVARDLPTPGDQVKVCMQAGVRPQTYPLIGRGCRDGAQTCTVFVGVHSHDHVRLQEYDAANPPVVVATDDICTQPSRPAAGVLGWTPQQD
ncbi:MAG: hypothetical protein REJ23_05240 [Brevundimonas sp.]|nr:hypothetical protein [Brevundimonas sp.]